jgi:lysophospholipase L1-like esterase
VLIPRVGKIAEPEAQRRLVQLAQDAGFTAIADFSDAFDRLDPERLRIDVNDYHPNADGHARLARRLEEFLSGIPEIKALWSMSSSREGANR